MTISAFMLPFLLMGMAEVFLFSLLHCWSSEAGDPICCSFGNGPVFFLNLLQWNHQFNSLDLRPLFSNNWYLISVHCPGMQTNNFFYSFCLVLNVRRNWNRSLYLKLNFKILSFSFLGRDHVFSIYNMMDLLHLLAVRKFDWGGGKECE